MSCSFAFYKVSGRKSGSHISGSGPKMGKYIKSSRGKWSRVTVFAAKLLRNGSTNFYFFVYLVSVRICREIYFIPLGDKTISKIYLFMIIYFRFFTTLHHSVHSSHFLLAISVFATNNCYGRITFVISASNIHILVYSKGWLIMVDFLLSFYFIL